MFWFPDSEKLNSITVVSTPMSPLLGWMEGMVGSRACDGKRRLTGLRYVLVKLPDFMLITNDTNFCGSSN